MTKPRLLLFGARGFLGGWLQETAAAACEVIPARADITNAAACAAAVEEARPAWVFLLAAISDIDRCQREPALAEAVNVRGAENVARACLQMGARLLFTSSGAVFDGTESGYIETDPVSPVSCYGKAKARAEQIVAGLVPDALIVRLSLVLGLARTARTNALLDKLLAAWQAGSPVAAPADEYRNAIDAGTLAKLLLELAAGGARGIYHAGSANALSRFDIARSLALQSGYAADLVQPMPDPPPERAPRGRYEFLRTEKLAAVCRTPIPACEEAIRRCAHAAAQSHS